ncbi:MAG: hypothetical protein [brine shrimp arlivirus 8]|nr:MAG: hypothetical protein [brine shrimp arlivirus 8]UNI74131.1 MAG: hypothetical protein [brine shrimp arlivirus 8]UNI74136.1 MAG: hypothetical protein [brine shrimp arlivirus 8]
MSNFQIPPHIPTDTSDAMRAAIMEVSEAVKVGEKNSLSTPIPEVFASQEKTKAAGSQSKIRSLIRPAILSASGESSATIDQSTPTGVVASQPRVRFADSLISSSEGSIKSKTGDDQGSPNIVDKAVETVVSPLLHTDDGNLIESKNDPVTKMNQRLESRADDPTEHIGDLSNLGVEISPLSDPIDKQEKETGKEESDSEDSIFSDHAQGDEKTKKGTATSVPVGKDTPTDPLVVDPATDTRDHESSSSDDVDQPTLEEQLTCIFDAINLLAQNQVDFKDAIEKLTNGVKSSVTDLRQDIHTLTLNQGALWDSFHQEWAAPPAQYDALRHTVADMSRKIDALSIRMDTVHSALPKVGNQLDNISRTIAGVTDLRDMVEDRLANVITPQVSTASYSHVLDDGAAFGDIPRRSFPVSQRRERVATEFSSTSNASSQLSKLAQADTLNTDEADSDLVVTRLFGRCTIAGGARKAVKKWKNNEANLTDLFPDISLMMSEIAEEAKIKGSSALKKLFKSR